MAENEDGFIRSQTEYEVVPGSFYLHKLDTLFVHFLLVSFLGLLATSINALCSWQHMATMWYKGTVLVLCRSNTLLLILSLTPPSLCLLLILLNRQEKRNQLCQEEPREDFYPTQTIVHFTPEF